MLSGLILIGRGLDQNRFGREKRMSVIISVCGFEGTIWPGGSVG